MKILIVGQFKIWALENHYTRYLKEYAEVETFPAEDIFDDYYQPSLLNKVKVKLGSKAIYQKISKELLAKIESCRPDIVWVFKGMRIWPETILAIKKMGVKIVNYNPDHPFEYHSKGSGNENVRNSVGYYDLHFTYSRNIQERIISEYQLRTEFLPFGFEMSEIIFDEIQNGAEINAICFIGNPDKTRIEYLTALAEEGLEVHVYGNFWDKAMPKMPNIKIGGPIHDLEFWQKMHNYRVQLNVFRPHNFGSHNMRTFEIPAAGSIMLGPTSREHNEFFKDKEEVFLYASKKEMVAKAKEILNMPDTAASVIGNNARQRSLISGYSYKDRAKQVYEIFNTL